MAHSMRWARSGAARLVAAPAAVEALQHVLQLAARLDLVAEDDRLPAQRVWASDFERQPSACFVLVCTKTLRGWLRSGAGVYAMRALGPFRPAPPARTLTASRPRGG